MLYLLLLLVVAIAPGIFLLLYVYYRDKYEKEPPALVIRTFIYGMLITFIAGTIELFFYKLFFEYFATTFVFGFALLYSFVIIGPVEEGAKYFVVVIGPFRSEEFNEPMDGIVYAVAASLGFATLENITYVLQGGLKIGLIRAFISVPVHAFLGVIMGYYFGKAKFENRKFLKQAFLYPALLHGFFDFVLLSKTWLALFVYPFLYFMARASLKDIKTLVEGSPFKDE